MNRDVPDGSSDYVMATLLRLWWVSHRSHPSWSGGDVSQHSSIVASTIFFYFSCTRSSTFRKLGLSFATNKIFFIALNRSLVSAAFWILLVKRASKSTSVHHGLKWDAIVHVRFSKFHIFDKRTLTDVLKLSDFFWNTILPIIYTSIVLMTQTAGRPTE